MGLPRFACLTGATILYGLTITGADDPLGAGLGQFLLIVTLAGLWGLFDGWRQPFGTGVIAWVLAAVLLVLLGPLPETLSRPADEGGWTGLSDYLSMITDGAGFMFALVAGPAFAGLGLGHLIRSSNRPPVPPNARPDVTPH